MCLQLFCPFAGLPLPPPTSTQVMCCGCTGIAGEGKTESEVRIWSHSPPSSFFCVHSVYAALVKGLQHLRISTCPPAHPPPTPAQPFLKAPPKALIKAETPPLPMSANTPPKLFSESATDSRAETSVHTRRYT